MSPFHVHDRVRSRVTASPGTQVFMYEPSRKPEFGILGLVSRHAGTSACSADHSWNPVNTVTSGRRRADVVLVGNTSASVADVVPTSRRRRYATEPTS